MTTFLGGPENIHVLIRPLELLVCGEENHIRDRALKSAEDIVSRMNEDQIMRHFVPLIQKLSTKDWYVLCHLLSLHIYFINCIK